MYWVVFTPSFLYLYRGWGLRSKGRFFSNPTHCPVIVGGGQTFLLSCRVCVHNFIQIKLNTVINKINKITLVVVVFNCTSNKIYLLNSKHAKFVQFHVLNSDLKEVFREGTLRNCHSLVYKIKNRIELTISALALLLCSALFSS